MERRNRKRQSRAKRRTIRSVMHYCSKGKELDGFGAKSLTFYAWKLLFTQYPINPLVEDYMYTRTHKGSRLHVLNRRQNRDAAQHANTDLTAYFWYKTALLRYSEMKERLYLSVLLVLITHRLVHAIHLKEPCSTCILLVVTEKMKIYAQKCH